MTKGMTPEEFATRVAGGVVLVDFWGPECAPCLALLPQVRALALRYDGSISLLEIDAIEHRSLGRHLGLLGLPAFLVFRDGTEVERLTRDDVTIEEIEAAIIAALQPQKEVSHGSEGQTSHRPR